MKLPARSLCLILSTTTAGAEVVSGRVVGVADGDTLTLLSADNTQYKIRISGIDAPEKRQSFGQRSKQSMSDLTFGKNAEANCKKRDRYGRAVCTVRVDGVDVGLFQIRNGLAWWYRKYAHEQLSEERRDYEAAESAAKTAGRGLWAEASPTAPWDWRHSRKGAH